MADLDDVRRLSLALPGVAEDERDWGFAVEGKRFVHLWRERVHPKKPKVPNREVIVLGTATLDDKDELIAAEDACFTEPHYDGYKAVLVRLPDADEALLSELLTDSWRLVAPPRLLSSLEE